MDRLSSCYFCGAALDASLSEYPVVPRELHPDPDQQRSVVLCPTCRRKLGAVIEAVVGTVEDGDGHLAAGSGRPTAGDPEGPGAESPEGPGAGDPADRGAVDPDGPETGGAIGETGLDDIQPGEGSLLGDRGGGDPARSGREGRDHGPTAGGDEPSGRGTDAGAGAETEVTTETGSESGPDAEMQELFGVDRSGDTDSEGGNPSTGRTGHGRDAGGADRREGGPGAGGASRGENDDRHSGTEEPAPADAGSAAEGDGADEGTDANADTDAGEADDGTDADDADGGEGGQSLSRLEYDKVMRLLQNREFPVDRAEIRTVAVSAYEISGERFDRVIEAAVERDLIAEEDGRLVRPE